MPRYTSLSFQCIDASIRAEDANFRLQSNTIVDNNANKQQVLLLSTENPAIPLYLQILNSNSTLDNQILFRSANDGVNQGFRIGLDSVNNQYVVQSDQKTLLFQNKTFGQSLRFDTSGNLAALLQNGSINLTTGSSVLQLNPTSSSLSTTSLGLNVSSALNISTGGLMNITNSGILTITGDVLFQGTNIKITTSHLLLENGLTIDQGNLIVNNASTLNGNVVVGGLTSLQALIVQQVLTTSSDATFGGKVTVSGTLTVSGTSTTLTNGPLLSQSTILSTFAGPVNISGAFQVLGNATTTLSGFVSALDNMTVTKQLNVLGVGGLILTQGPLTLQQGSLSITSGSLSVQNGITCSSGGFALTGDLVQATGSIVTSGNVTLKSGTIYLQQGQLQITTPAGVNGIDIQFANLHVGGQTQLDALVTLANGLTVTSGATSLQGLTVNQLFSTTTNADIGGTLRVKDIATFIANIVANSDLNVTGSSTFGNLLTASGGILSKSAITVNNGANGPIVQLTNDGSRSVFNNGLKVLGLSLDLSAGLNVKSGNFVVAQGSTSTFNDVVNLNGLATFNAGLSVPQDPVSIGSGGLSLTGSLLTSGSTTFNGPTALNGAVTLAGNITSTTSTVSVASIVANTLRNLNSTFTVDANGNILSNSTNTGPLNATSAVLTGPIQASSFSNTNASFTVDGNGAISGQSILINSKVKLTATNAGTTYSINLPASPPVSNGQALVSDTNGNLSWTNDIASPYPAAYTFMASNNQSTSSNITNLLFSAAGRNVYIETVLLLTTSSTKQKALYTLTGWKDASGDADWHMRYTWSGTNLGLSFAINSATSQVSYTSPNYANFTSMTFIISFF